MALTRITSGIVADNTLAVANIADNAVDATKIASNSILTRHIDDDQITGDQLADALTVVTSVTTPLVDAATIDSLIIERKQARESKDFTRADEIREELTKMGVEIEDTPKGTIWRTK